MDDVTMHGQLNEDARTNSAKKTRAGWLSGALAATSFACVLTAVSGNVHGDHVSTAMKLFSIALPLLVFNTLRVKEVEPHRYCYGLLSAVAVILGVLSAVSGIAMFLWQYDTSCAFYFLATSLLCGLLVHSAQTNAVKKQQRKMKIAA